MGKNTIGRITAAAGLFILSSMNVPSASAAGVGVMSCIADATYTATGSVAGWLPTNQASPFTTTPRSIAIGGVPTTYVTATRYSGTPSITVSSVVAAANAAFATNYVGTNSTTTSTSFVQSIMTTGNYRLLVLHKADKVTFTKYQNNADCTTTTYTGLVAYVPTSSTAVSSLCVIADRYPAKTNWSPTCTD